MTGFINRLFRRGPKPSVNGDATAAKPKQGGAYYLDPDDAKTYGNIDYMRTAKKVRKTFMGGKMEVIEEISSTEKRMIGEPVQQTEEGTTLPASEPAPQSQRRRASAEMDMFRNMAKDLGKKS